MAQLSNTTRSGSGGVATMLALLVAVLVGIAGGLARDWPSGNENAAWLSSAHHVMFNTPVAGSGHQCRCDDDIHHVSMASRRDDGATLPHPMSAAASVAVVGRGAQCITPPLAAGSSRSLIPDRRIAILRTTRLVI